MKLLQLLSVLPVLLVMLLLPIHQGWLLEYFTSRDVTLNEVLILKEAQGTAVFYYTRDAFRDAQLQLVSSACLSEPGTLLFCLYQTHARTPASTHVQRPQEPCFLVARRVTKHCYWLLLFVLVFLRAGAAVCACVQERVQPQLACGGKRDALCQPLSSLQVGYRMGHRVTFSSAGLPLI